MPEHRRFRPRSPVVVMVLAIVAVGCGGGQPGVTPQATAEDPNSVKLAQVLERGTLVLSTDLAYAPQSYAVDGAARDPQTACAENQLTADEVAGYDADTGKLVAAALGLEPCFVDPPFSTIIAGNWGDLWDVAWASGALTEERMTRLYMTQPYYSTPHVFFVHADSEIQDAGDLEGQEVGACAGCTQDQYLRHELELPGERLEYAILKPVIVTYDAEPAGLEAVVEGDIDAFLCSEPVGAELIAKGLPLRALPEPAYYTQKSGYADRGSRYAMGSFLDRVNETLRMLHADGRLRVLSERYFGQDYAAAAGAFDLAAIEQAIR